MTENLEIPERKRRSTEEIKRLVIEFEASELRRNEFCQSHSLARRSAEEPTKEEDLARIYGTPIRNRRLG